MRWSLMLAVWLHLGTAAGSAEPKVTVVLGENAPAIERQAAEDVAGLLTRLYQTDVKIATQAEKNRAIILVGSPVTNTALQPFSKDWARLSDQGHVVRSVQYQDQLALIIGGGSPAATLWAAAEFAHALGVRSLLYADLDPVSRRTFSLEGFDIVREPALVTRGWELSYDFPHSAAAWSLTEQQRLIGQLGKLKFNRLVIRVRSEQPFVHYEGNGVKKQTGELFHGKQFPVSGDTAGRAAFRGAKVFENADFAGKKTYDERLAAGQTLLRGVIDAAHRSGMTVALALDPFQFSKEFSAEKNGKQSDAARRNLAKVQLQAYLDAYPGLDALYLTATDKHSLEALQPLLAELQKPRQLAIAIQVDSTHDGKDRATNPKWGLLYDCALEDAEKLVSTSVVDGAPKSLLLHLGNHRAGVLPLSAQTIVAKLLPSLRQREWDGYVAQCWNMGELDLSAYLLSRGSFDEKLTPDEACQALVTPICGDEVAGRVIKALDYIERATMLLGEYDPAFSSPAMDMVLKQFESDDPPPPAWGQAREAYLNAMNEMYRANSRARDGGRSYTLYLARRCEFGFEYLNSIEAVRKAGIAKRKEDSEGHIAELEKAMESMNNALNALAAVSRTSSDRGTIALLNEYGYRPLVNAVEAADADK